MNKLQLAEELQSTRLMLYPTHCLENFCLSAVEAQAAGVPVISSTLGALPETIQTGVTGILINGLPGTVEYQNKFIQLTIKLLTNDELWQKMSVNAQEQSRKLFDSEIIAKQWDQEIKRLISKCK